MKLLYRVAPMFLAILVIGCAANPAQNTRAGAGGVFAPPGAGFTVDMPGKIRESRSDGEYRFSAEGNDIAYFVAYFDSERLKGLNAAQVSRALDGGTHALVDRTEKTLSLKTITVDGHEGRDLSLLEADGRIMRIRVTLVRGRLFMVGVATKGRHVKTAEAAHFLESFHVTMH